jgi:CheY-like chemotaxis protein
MTAIHHNILHVEDDPNDILLVQRAFRKANLTVTLASVQDGDRAVAYLSGAEAYGDRENFPLPVLILLDLKIPRKSGFEVLAWIRSHPELKRLPVTILTSSKHDRDVTQAYELGANSYLVKPVGFDALVEMARMIGAYWLLLNERPML